MRRILLSLMIIALVGALIGGGIYAYFSDTEASTGNTFTAGTLDLQVGSADPCTETVNIPNLKPTASGNAAIWLTQNTGSINGTLDIELSAITNNENTRSEVEIDAGDTTDDPNGGELGTLLEVAFWMDVDKTNGWSDGDYYLNSAGTKVSWQIGESVLPAAAYAILNNYASDSWSDVQTVNATTEAGNFRVEYDFPEGGSGDNVAQSDDCVFDITFTLTQA